LIFSRYKVTMQTKNPFFDEFSKFATSAAGVAQGVGEEARAFWRSQMERIIADMDLVRRDEFDAVKDLAAAARAETEALKARLTALESQAASAGEPTAKARAPKKTG
jgi:BMFP domain-containing protein YqiC